MAVSFGVIKKIRSPQELSAISVTLAETQQT